MLRRVSGLALITFIASAAQAETPSVRRGPASSWVVPSPLLALPENASGAVFVRRQDLQIHLSDQGQAQYLGYRIKILNSSALQLGNISIAWNPPAGAPIVHEIKVYREGQVVDVLAKSSFEILRREDQLEAAKLDGTLTAVLRVADLRVGDELEVSLTSFGSDPTLGHNESGILLLTPTPAAGRYHLGLSWDEGQKPNIKPTADMTTAMSRTERSVDFRFDNPATISAPKEAPGRFSWLRAVEYSDFPSWAAMSAYFAPIYTNAAKLSANSPIRLEAKRIAGAQSAPLDRASAALKLVQQDVRYIYVGLNGGNLTPASAEETWQRRYGDCKGKTALLLALLEELGIAAEPVLVNSSGADDGADKHLPIPQLFDHVLVRAHIDGKVYWLDGTLPPVALPSTKPIFPFNWVLPLTARGTTIERLNWQPPVTPDEINLYEIDARGGFDKPAHIVTTKIVRGVDGIKEQLQFSSASASQILEAFRQNAIGDTWQAIYDVQWRYDQKAAASVLKISGTGVVKWDDDGAGAKSLALPGGGFSPPDQRLRAPGPNVDAPFYTKPEFTCHVTTVRLPSTTQPGQWSSKKSFDTHIFGRTYHRAWELRDGAIRMIRSSRVDEPEIDAAVAIRDNGRIAAFDNSMGWISYDPAGKKGLIGKGEKVPATYDIDWTADNVPCLAQTTTAPSQQQITAFMVARPDLFAQRKIYTLDQIQFTVPPADKKLLKALEPITTMAGVERVLAEANVKFKRARGRLDPTATDPALIKRILQLPPGEIFVVPNDGTLVANQITKAQVVPFVGDEANRYASTHLND